MTLQINALNRPSNCHRQLSWDREPLVLDHVLRFDGDTLLLPDDHHLVTHSHLKLADFYFQRRPGHQICFRIRDFKALQINNWDEEAVAFKYVGAEEKGTTNPMHQLFEPCNKEFELRLGYLSELTLMMTGTFTSIEPHFPNSGKPTLTRP